MAAPCAVGMLVAVAVALTLIPAVITVGGRFGLLDPKRQFDVRGWRRVGTAVVRWPAPIFAASVAVTMVGLLALPGYKVSYIDRDYIPKSTPANVGYGSRGTAFLPGADDARDADGRVGSRHAQFGRLPGLGQTGQRTSSVVEGIARVQSETRPQGTPLEHTSIPFLLSMQNAWGSCRTCRSPRAGSMT